MTANSKSGLYLKLFGIGFVLNLVWELLQMPFFSNLSESGYLFAAFYCSIASVIDGVTIIFIFFVLEKTIGYGNRRYYPVAGILGAACAVLFEWIALSTGLWSYELNMPIVPILRIGAIPFFQLLILVPLSIYATNKLAGRNYEDDSSLA